MVISTYNLCMLWKFNSLFLKGFSLLGYKAAPNYNCFNFIKLNYQTMYILSLCYSRNTGAVDEYEVLTSQIKRKMERKEQENKNRWDMETTNPNNSSGIWRFRIILVDGRLQCLVEGSKWSLSCSLKNAATPKSQTFWQTLLLQILFEIMDNCLRWVLWNSMEFLKPCDMNCNCCRPFRPHLPDIEIKCKCVIASKSKFYIYTCTKQQECESWNQKTTDA